MKEICPRCEVAQPEEKLVYVYRHGVLHRFMCKRCYKEERRIISTK